MRLGVECGVWTIERLAQQDYLVGGEKTGGGSGNGTTRDNWGIGKRAGLRVQCLRALCTVRSIPVAVNLT